LNRAQRSSPSCAPISTRLHGARRSRAVIIGEMAAVRGQS
jgi:hypothetical protein